VAARLSSLTNRRYYFELATTPNVIWMDLAKFDLNAGAPVMILDPDNIDLAGNVSAKFQKTSKVPF
jgi:choloylglycine hydrolase